MFLDHILRPAEVKEFESTLKPHQLAKISQTSNERLASRAQADDDMPVDAEASTRTGPSTVLDRAVMEHNLLSSSNIYNNITFSGLGALLDLAPAAAETMARKMIEQGRLRGWIDQVEKLIWFEGPSEEDDAQGKAGGLGDVDLHTDETGAPYTKKWDLQIRRTAANVRRVSLMSGFGMLTPVSRLKRSWSISRRKDSFTRKLFLLNSVQCIVRVTNFAPLIEREWTISHMAMLESMTTSIAVYSERINGREVRFHTVAGTESTSSILRFLAALSSLYSYSCQSPWSELRLDLGHQWYHKIK